MAWSVSSGTQLSMAEGDFGVALPITINGITFGENDSVEIVFKKTVNGENLLVKEYTNVQNNTVELMLTEEESNLFPVGNFVYRLDWYQSGIFMQNIIPRSTFKVVDKI